MDQNDAIFQGNALLRQHRIREAEHFFAEAVRLFPDEPWPREGHARAALKAGNIEDAQARFEDLLRVFPDHPDVRLELAEIQVRLSNFDAAARLYEEHLRRNSVNTPKARYGLLRALFRQEDLPRAERLARDIAATTPGEWGMRARQTLANIRHLREHGAVPGVPVDRVISLGGKCEVAWHLRRHYDVDTAYPFDWWITPFPAMRGVIENDFRGLFDNFSIEERTNGNNTAMRRTYGLLYHHDFNRPVKRIEPKNLEAQAAAARKKYAFLAERFRRALRRGRVLLLHLEHTSLPPLPPREAETSLEELESFMEMLVSRYDNPRLHLLHFGTRVREASGRNVTCMPIRVYDDTVPQYCRHFRGWAELLYTCGFELPPGGAP